MNATTLVKNMPLQQKRAGKLLLGFFCLILALTLISRSLDASAIPTVTTVPVASGSLSRKVVVSGTVESLGQTAVSAPSGFLIVGMPVEVGSRVEEGDLLALLDLEKVEEELAQARRSLEKLRLNASLDQLEAEKPVPATREEAELALERAKEDLERVREEGSVAVRRAERELSNARKDRKDMRDNDASDEDLITADRDITSLIWAVDDAKRAAEEKETAALRAIEDAERAIERAELDLAADSSQDQVDETKRAIQSQIASLDMAELQVEIAKLEALLESEGRVTAPVTGVVTHIGANLGTLTPAESLMLVSDTSQGSQFRGYVEEDLGKYLDRGDAGQIQANSLRDPLEASISSLMLPEEKGGDYTVSASLPGSELESGSSATLTVEKRSQSYSQMVPLSALHSDGASTTSGYVFVLREAATAMGEETVVAKVPVQILEKSDQYAGVEGVFAPDDRIVSSSSRALADGDRVQVAAQ